VLPADQDVVHGRLRVGLHEGGELVERAGAVFLPGRDRLADLLPHGGILREPFRQVVVAELERVGVLPDQGLLCGGPFLRRQGIRLQNLGPLERLELPEAFREELVLERPRDRLQARLQRLNLVLDRL
jgi:hypothetical protein